jgi:bleomycin hydrolase
VLDKNASNLKEMFDIDFSLSKRASLETRTSLPNHAMTFIGAHKEKSGTIKRWKVENSHGDDGALKGFITMSDSWFNEYVICAAVPVDCLPVVLRDEAMKKKKVKWLPFYSPLGTYSS